MDLTKDGEVNEGRQETGARRAPFRIRGTHVRAIATAKAEEKARRENARSPTTTRRGPAVRPRVPPLRAAAKFARVTPLLFSASPSINPWAVSSSCAG